MIKPRSEYKQVKQSTNMVKHQRLARGFITLLSVLALFKLREAKRFKTSGEYYFLERDIDGCRSDKLTHVFYLEFDRYTTGKKISFNLKSGTPLDGKEFITHHSDPSKKVYGLFELGGDTCYTHKTTGGVNLPQVFVVYLEKAGDNPFSTACAFKYIITKSDIEPCGSQPHEPLVYGVLHPQDESGTNNQNSFQKLFIDTNFYDGTPWLPLRHTLEDFSVEDITEQLVEMFLLGALMPTPRGLNPAYLVDYQRFRYIYTDLNENLNLAYQRMFTDDIPGYYLGKLEGESPSGIQESYRMESISGVPANSYVFSLYIAKPLEILPGQVHTTLFKIDNSEDNLRGFEYKIETTKVGSDYQFSVYRIDTNQVSTLVKTPLLYPDSGSKNFLYFALVVGYGELYRIDQDNLRLKVYETLVVYQPGGQKINMLGGLEENDRLDAIYKDTVRPTINPLGKFEVSYSVTGAPTQFNTAGFRVIDLTTLVGLIPPFLVSSHEETSEFPHCFLYGFNKGLCFAGAMLENFDDMKSSFEINDKYEITKPNPNSFNVQNCKFVYNKYHCVISKEGFINNIDIKQKNPALFKAIPMAEYNAFNPIEKGHYCEFTNNIGTKYLVSCPHLCNFFTLSADFLVRWNMQAEFAV